MLQDKGQRYAGSSGYSDQLMVREGACGASLEAHRKPDKCPGSSFKLYYPVVAIFVAMQAGSGPTVIRRARKVGRVTERGRR
jgi:hypothetical protein